MSSITSSHAWTLVPPFNPPSICSQKKNRPWAIIRTVLKAIEMSESEKSLVSISCKPVSKKTAETATQIFLTSFEITSEDEECKMPSTAICSTASDLGEYCDVLIKSTGDKEEYSTSIQDFTHQLFKATKEAFENTTPLPFEKGLNVPTQVVLDLPRFSTSVKDRTVPCLATKGDQQANILFYLLLGLTNSEQISLNIMQICTQATIFDMTKLLIERFQNMDIGVAITQRSTSKQNRTKNTHFKITKEKSNGKLFIEISQKYQVLYGESLKPTFSPFQSGNRVPPTRAVANIIGVTKIDYEVGSAELSFEIPAQQIVSELLHKGSDHARKHALSTQR
jgi:hypothetical protein